MHRAIAQRFSLASSDCTAMATKAKVPLLFVLPAVCGKHFNNSLVCPFALLQQQQQQQQEHLGCTLAILFAQLFNHCK